MTGTTTVRRLTRAEGIPHPSAANTLSGTAYLLLQLRRWENPINATDPTGLRLNDTAESGREAGAVYHEAQVERQHREQADQAEAQSLAAMSRGNKTISQAVADELARAQQLNAAGPAYGHNSELAGTVIGLDLIKYDCSNVQSAVAQKPMQPIVDLMNPAKRGSGWQQIDKSQYSPGDWVDVKYYDPADKTVEYHGQMNAGGGRYFDSVPYQAVNMREGPSYTNNPVEHFASTGGRYLIGDPVYLRPIQ